MTPWWWSWLLMSVGIAGLWMAGRKNAWGWVLGIAAQVLWFAYAVSTQQWGFLVSCFAYGWVYVTNARRWFAEDKARAEEVAA